ncbi:Hypothetical predicted protein [Octopus vulgaris]|uniref:Uncharacterized protein n=1 Tax=Octopus vulgaris TaxID=6645 RepID=A0AA36B3T6_OCTVU|nr:Hypothetical predicted protein [Octopus vulgaris]
MYESLTDEGSPSKETVVGSPTVKTVMDTSKLKAVITAKVYESSPSGETEKKRVKLIMKTALAGCPGTLAVLLLALFTSRIHSQVPNSTLYNIQWIHCNSSFEWNSESFITETNMLREFTVVTGTD